MWGLLAGLLWVGTFIMFPIHFNGFWSPKDAVWLLGSFLLASSPFWNVPTQPTAPNRWLGFFLAYLIAGFGWLVLWPQLRLPGVDSSQLAIRLPWNVVPILPTFAFLGSILAMDAMIRHTDSLHRWHRVALHLVRIGTLVAVIAIGQVCHLDPFGKIPLDHSATSIFGNPTITGNFLAVCAPLALMFQAKRYRIGAYSVMVLATFLTVSASSVAALLIASSVIWWRYHKRWLVGGVVLLSLIGLMVVLHQGELHRWLSLGGRWQMWQRILEVWRLSPTSAWLGYGAGDIGMLTARGVWRFGYAHNEPLQLLFEHGVVGATLLGLAVWTTLHRVWKAPSTPSLIAWCGAALAYGLIACVNFPLRIGTLLMLGCVIWAALEAHAQHQEPRHA